MLTQLANHAFVAFPRRMYMLHGNIQGYKLIQKPCDVNIPIFFRYYNYIALFRK